MKKFISGSFITLSLLCALGLRCGAAKLPNIPENIKNVVLQNAKNDDEQKAINNQIINFLAGKSTKSERIEAFWELCKMLAPERSADFRRHIERIGDYDIYYSENEHTVCAIGRKWHTILSRPTFFLMSEEYSNYCNEHFLLVSSEGASTEPIVGLL